MDNYLDNAELIMNACKIWYGVDLKPSFINNNFLINIQKEIYETVELKVKNTDNDIDDYSFSGDELESLCRFAKIGDLCHITDFIDKYWDDEIFTKLSDYPIDLYVALKVLLDLIYKSDSNTKEQFIELLESIIEALDNSSLDSSEIIESLFR